jgi:hypothetical protein
MARSAKLLSLFTGDFKPCGDKGPLQCGFQDLSARIEVSCADYQGERSAVLLTFGQSNSANAGRDRYIPAGKVANFNIHNGKCYLAEDPLLGPDGSGGSVWGVLADKLISAGEYDRVLLIPFGIGASSLAQWQTSGFLHPILKKASEAVKEQGIEPTQVLWHQGEADAKIGTTEVEYISMFGSLVDALRSYGVEAPVYPAVATHCQMFAAPDEAHLQRSKVIRSAQQRLPELDGVFAGPNTDVLQGPLYRHDNCHFNARGMQAHADLWLKALVGPVSVGASQLNGR